MGCHTWFKVQSKYTLEELRVIWITQQTDWISYWKEMTSNAQSKDRLDERLWKDKPQEWFEWGLKVYEREVRMVENKTIKQAFVNHLSKTDEGDNYDLVNGVIYATTDACPHDIFRRGEYPEDQLFSFEETLAYLETHSDIIDFGYKNHTEMATKEEAIEELRNFWDKNPIGMIYFG